MSADESDESDGHPLPPSTRTTDVGSFRLTGVMPPSTLRRTSGIAFGIVAIVLLIVSTLAFRTVHRSARANQSVAHTYAVLNALEGVWTTMVDAEAAVRGFVITGTRGYLQPFSRAERGADSQIDALAALTADDDVQRQNLSALRTEARATIALLGDMVAHAGPRSATPTDASDRERASMEAVRATLQRMRAEQERLMGEGVREAGSADAQTRALMNGLIAVAFGVLAVSFLFADRRAVQLDDLTRSLADRVRERTAELERALVSERDARAQAERVKAEREHLLARLESLISHAPIGIALFDTDLRCISINDRGAAPSGLSTDAFIGRPLRDFQPWGSRVESLLAEVVRRRSAITVEVSGEAPAMPGETGHWVESYFPVLSRHGDVLAIGAVALDMTERKRAEDERVRLLERERQARAEADEANRAKDVFIARASHELRTPLNALMGWARMLRDGRVPPAKQEQALASIDRNADVLKTLVDDLIEMSRMTTGGLQLDRRRLDAAALARESLQLLEPAAAARNIHVEADIDPRSMVVDGDSTRFRQIVWNLLSNAIKFTPAHGRVTLTVRPAGEEVEIRVSDTGQGIAPEFLPHIFEPFAQAERGGHGLGLGLAIVHQLVAAHGGRISAASGGVDAGTTLTVHLPLVRVPEAV